MSMKRSVTHNRSAKRLRRLMADAITRKAYVAPRVKEYVKHAINGAEETKYLDIAVSITASSTTFGYVDISGAITTGTARGNRVGGKIKVLGMRYLLEVDPGDNQNVVRILAFAYKPGGTGPTGTSAIPSLVGAVNTDLFRPYIDRIHEARFAPVDGSTSATVSINKYYRGYIPVNRVLNYGTGTQAVTNSLYLQFHSDSAVAPNPGLRGYIRIYYKDA